MNKNTETNTNTNTSTSTDISTDATTGSCTATYHLPLGVKMDGVGHPCNRLNSNPICGSFGVEGRS